VKGLGTGYLAVSIYTADKALPVNNALVLVSYPNGELLYSLNTDESGQTETVAIEAPDKSRTLDPNDSGPHYTKVDVNITAPGFERTIIRCVHICDTSTSLLPVKLIPLSIERSSSIINEISIPESSVESNKERTQEGPADYVNPQKLVTIPRHISVHLGAPASKAQNVRVPFVDYIKNVVSNEIYDTWPEAAIEANILCAITFVLNRVYSVWYPEKGYGFDITNNIQYDQCYVYNGFVGGNIARITDNIFNCYIRLQGHTEPYFTSYCKNADADCRGLSQWGTVPLAQSGMDALQILRNFYPPDIEIAETFNFAGISVPYPGYELREGYNNDVVGTIKSWLSRISVNYPNIPPISSLDNNVFDPETREALKEFQRTFDLDASGVVDKATWYRLAQINGVVKKLSDLNDESETVPIDSSPPAYALREGSRGLDVARLQFLLNYFSQFYSSVPQVIENAVFDDRTKTSVLAFQKLVGTTADGVIGPVTWQIMYNIYKGIKENVEAPQVMSTELSMRYPYPGFPLRSDSGGSAVMVLQMMLNHLSDYYPQIPKVAEDGYFGSFTQSAVYTFQNIFGLNADGIVGQETWNELVVQLDKVGGMHPRPRYPGYMLRRSTAGEPVRLIQSYLSALSLTNPSIPKLSADGIYGEDTENAVKAFQKDFGLTVDGIIGQGTWNSIVDAYFRGEEGQQEDTQPIYYSDALGSYVFTSSGLPNVDENNQADLYGSWLQPMYDENSTVNGTPAQTWQDADIYGQADDLFAYQRPYEPGTGTVEDAGQAQTSTVMPAGQAQTGTAVPSGQAQTSIVVSSGQPQSGTAAASGQPRTAVSQQTQAAQIQSVPTQTVQAGTNQTAQEQTSQPAWSATAYPAAQTAVYGPAYPVVVDQPVVQTDMYTQPVNTGSTGCVACGQAVPAAVPEYAGAVAVNSGKPIADTIFNLFLLRLLYMRCRCWY
jgi:peptidoglycan hydrolase-like protein with peptidoglycan-binding domain